MAQAKTDGHDKRRLWREALSDSSVWSRACKLGLSVGLIQVAINQGDFWLNHRVSLMVIIKSVLTPLVTLSVALISAAATYVEKQRYYYEKQS